MRTLSKSADAKARDYTDEAIDVLREVMIDPLAEHRDRLRAAETLLDRGHGKAVSAVISIPAGRRAVAQLASMTDDELMEAIRQEPLPRLAAPEEPEYFTCPVKGCPGDHRNELELCAEVEPAIDPLLR
jgi:hypothetical protein